jgi:hypothetical protein
MIDSANFGNATLLEPVEGEVGYEQTRMDQALKAAGVPPHMLNAMDKAALVAALSMDNRVFEEGSGLSAFMSVGGFRDQLHFSAEERAELEKKKDIPPEEVEAETSILGRNIVAMVFSARRRHPLAFMTIEDDSGLQMALGEAGSIFQQASAKHDMTREESAFIIFDLAKQAMGGELYAVSPLTEYFTAEVLGCQLPNRKMDMGIFSPFNLN